MDTRDEPSLRREERFEELYRSCFAQVLAYALRRAPREVAHDVVADTFLVAWRRLDELPDEPLPWLFGVARKTLANHRRSSRRRNALLGELETREEAQFAGVDEPTLVSGEVAAVIGRLPARERELLLLVAWEGLSVVEAARVLGERAATCRVRLHRARRRLAREFAREAGGSEPLITIPKEQL